LPSWPGVLLNVNLNPLCIGFLVGAVYEAENELILRMAKRHGLECLVNAFYEGANELKKCRLPLLARRGGRDRRERTGWWFYYQNISLSHHPVASRHPSWPGGAIQLTSANSFTPSMIAPAKTLRKSLSCVTSAGPTRLTIPLECAITGENREHHWRQT